MDGIAALASLLYLQDQNLFIRVDIQADYFGSGSAVYVAIVGGNCNNGDNCGAFYLNWTNATNTNWNYGACLSYIISLKYKTDY